MDDIGYLRASGGRVEFHFDELGLVVRGAHAEWVLEAAAEIISTTAKLESDGRLEELTTLLEFGEASEMEVDSAKLDAKARFEILPQCIVTMGALDYKWTCADGRAKDPASDPNHPLKRLQDMSLTRNDSFLHNEDGVTLSGE